MTHPSLYACAVLEASVDGLRLEDAGIGWHGVREPDVTADGGVVADGDAAENGGVGIDGHVVLENRVTGDVEHVALLVVLETLGTKGDALIERDVVADDGSLANDDARAVVDGEILAYLCTRMDVDTSLGMGQLGDNAWDDGHAQFMQTMGDAVVGHRVHDGIAEDDLAVVPGGRIGVEHGLHVGIEQTLDLGQRVDELHRQPLSLAIDLSLRAHLLAVLTELESVGDLLDEQRGQLLHVDANVIRADGLIGLPLVEIVGKDDALDERHNLLHLLH